MRVLFWGTPDFAVPPLRALLGEGYDIVGVVTQPDRPRGRSRSRLDPSPVKVVALEEGLPVLQPERPRGDEFVQSMRALEPDLSVVVAYGHIIPKAVIELPSRGTVNIHGSLLPLLRGAAPIQRAILEGHAETGITIMQMVFQLDAGPMLHVVRTPIEADETYGELHDRLSEFGAMAIVQALVLLETDALTPVAQDDALATYAAKITRETTIIDWSQPALTVARCIRAFDPRPGAVTEFGSASVKCFGARVVHASDSTLSEADSARPSGTVLAIDESGLKVRCGTGVISIAEVQPAGRSRQTADAWQRGRGISVGDRFDLPPVRDYLSSHDTGGGT